MRSYARVALYSVMVNAFLMSLKYVLGELSGSLALKADAVHSFADVISAFTIFVGIVIADRKTKTFPEGLYKVENLVALLSAFFIFFAAFEIGTEALHAQTVGQLSHFPHVIGGILVVIGVAFAFSRYELRVGLKAGSPSLVADAKHVYTDLLSTVVILFSVVGAAIGYPLDRYVALFVAVLVARTGFQIMVDAVKVLLDATLDQETLLAIRKILESHPDVTDVESVGGRSSGRYKVVEVSLRMHTRLLSDAHEIVSHLEEEILDRWPEIDKILIHYEPQHREVWRIAVPVNDVDGHAPNGNASLADHFGEAPFFILLAKNTVTGALHVEDCVPNPFHAEPRRKGVKAAELLAGYGADEIVTKASLEGKGAGYALEALDIVHSVTSVATLPELTKEIAATN